MQFCLNSFADGAMAERFNQEMQKVIENIMDPNTDPTKARKVTLTISVKSNDKRELINVAVQGKCTLAAAKDVETQLLVDYDGNGKVTAGELKSGAKGQTFMDTEGDISTDTGEKIVKFK
ncbi:replication terminator protein [Bacillus sp. REN10]|uniref:replication terminator protein n=1 Tax=Bacillus sp. REN10 TaxID=2782541 RepID=UPI00193BAF96|nr:replication terminator protein [Bacillus sp. REN10]